MAHLFYQPASPQPMPMSQPDSARIPVADPDELPEEPPDDYDLRCPEYPATHTQVELRKGYFYCEECEKENEHPRFQFIYAHSLEVLISHFDYMEQWRAYESTKNSR